MSDSEQDHPYKYSVEECDVEDKAALSAYRSLRARWLHLMAHEPRHAVWHQINGMFWNYAAFRVANESRRLAEQAGEPRSAQNGLIGELLDEGFIATQSLAVRRLQERPNKEPGKQVVSLGRLLADIAANQKLITREHFVAYDGDPYDYTVDRPELANDVGWRALDKFDHSADAHKLFDRLSRVDAHDRQRSDRLHPDVLGLLFRRLQDPAVLEVADYATRFVAHSADEQSRSASAVQGLSFSRLEASHRALYEVAWKLYSQVLHESDYSALPIAQGDILIHMEHPWATESDHEALWELWNTQDEKYDSWRVSFFRDHGH